MITETQYKQLQIFAQLLGRKKHMTKELIEDALHDACLKILSKKVCCCSLKSMKKVVAHQLSWTKRKNDMFLL